MSTFLIVFSPEIVYFLGNLKRALL